jgi:hypothetical protein
MKKKNAFKTENIHVVVIHASISRYTSTSVQYYTECTGLSAGSRYSLPLPFQRLQRPIAGEPFLLMTSPLKLTLLVKKTRGRRRTTSRIRSDSFPHRNQCRISHRHRGALIREKGRRPAPVRAPVCNLGRVPITRFDARHNDDNDACPISC